MKHKTGFHYYLLLFVTILTLNSCKVSFIQNGMSSNVYNKYIKATIASSNKINFRINKTSRKYLKKYLRMENSTNRKLCKINPALADHLFSVVNDPLLYNNEPGRNLALLKENNPPKEYFPHYDTIQSSLAFMNKVRFEGVDTLTLLKANREIKQLDSSFLYTEKLQQYFRQRKMTIKETLTKYPELKSSVTGYDRVNYYYHEQISSYKKLFSNPERMQSEVIKSLNINRAFNEFIEKNGILSSFSRIPSSNGKSLGALQTIAQTKDLMLKSITALGNVSKDMIVDKMKQMQGGMDKLKSGDFGKVTNAADVPEFKPNPMKTNSLINRILFSTNFSVNQTNTFYPSIVNTGLQVAYKLTKKINPGLGISYILGMGSNWNKTSLTHQGVGLGSFVDYKISKLLFMESGFERNFKHRIQNLDQLKEMQYWQNSALIGLKLKYKVGTSYGVIVLLYDCLYESHSPNSQALVYRVGWEF